MDLWHQNAVLRKDVLVKFYLERKVSFCNYLNKVLLYFLPYRIIIKG